MALQVGACCSLKASEDEAMVKLWWEGQVVHGEATGGEGAAGLEVLTWVDDIHDIAIQER